MVKKFFLSLLVFSQFSLWADSSEIESLEKKRWELIKNQNWKELENLIAPYFQSSYYAGTDNKEQALRRLESLKIGDYTLSNFRVTEGPDVAIVTYDIALSETIDDNRISSKAGRLSVWQKNQGKWQIIAHAILIPVPV